MAFELRPSASTRKDLSRLARKELGAARKELVRVKHPPRAAVHNARKSVKKARAILALVEADHGHGLGGSRRRLRAVNRVLSCLRDADALIETLQKLQHDHPELFSGHVYARVRRQLTSRKQTLSREASAKGWWTTLARQLRDVEKLAKRWRTADDGFEALAPGVEKTHRAARKAMARARDSEAAADFHEWRKALKSLWYELRLVGGGSAAIRKDIRALDSAERWLGDDHNLVVLCAQLSKDRPVRRSAFDLRRLQRAVETSQRRLRRQAIARTRLIFATTSRGYVHRVERAWNARQTAARTARKRHAA